MFYEYEQNNPGGSFDYDPERGISVHVIVEADNAEEANRRAESIGLYFGGAGDCPCCGNRWYKMRSDAAGGDVPSVYGMPVQDVEWGWGPFSDGDKWLGPDEPEVFVHFKDGQVQAYGFGTKVVGK